MTPIVNGLEREFEDQLTIVQLDAGQKANAELLIQYGLSGHPSFAVLDNNSQVVQRFFGPQTEATLRGAIAAVTDQ